MTTFRLYKKEKLCSKTAIDLIFTRGEGSVATSFPLRAVWRINEHRTLKTPQFLISIPKRRFKHAVDRVKLRRRTREAYRLNRKHLIVPEDIAIDIAFIYLGNTFSSYTEIESAIIKLLGKISKSVLQISAEHLTEPQNETSV